MPRILNEPPGCRFSSFSQTWLVCKRLDSSLDSMQGVSRYNCFIIALPRYVCCVERVRAARCIAPYSEQTREMSFTVASIDAAPETLPGIRTLWLRLL